MSRRLTPMELEWVAGGFDVLRTIIFLVGLGIVLVGISSYFHGVPIPVDYSSTFITVGAAEFRLDLVLVLLGVPVILFSSQSIKAK